MADFFTTVRLKLAVDVAVTAPPSGRSHYDGGTQVKSSWGGACGGWIDKTMAVTIYRLTKN